jgi:hypothetical protein
MNTGLLDAERDIFQSYQISEKNQSSLININDHLISQIPLCVKEIFNSAANETDDDKCGGVAFSCAYLYTVQTIEPDHLEDIDRSIFDGFLQSPEGFVIGLAPILLRTYCSKDGYYGDFSTRFKILPAFKVYERSPVDGTISISICREVPPDTIAYYQTGSELVEMVDNIPHLAYTGNESQHGMNEYRSVAFVVFEKKTKTNATRKQMRHQKKKR